MRGREREEREYEGLERARTAERGVRGGKGERRW